MSEEDKPQPSQLENIPKCEQEIVAIMKNMGITEYEPEAIAKLKEFVFKQSTAVLQEARMYANNSNKESPDVDDVRRAIQSTKVRTPPSQEVLRKCANKSNHTPLPPMRRGCGLRLPPNRNCASSCDYCLKTTDQEKSNSNYSGSSQESATKISTNPNVSCVKKNTTEVTKHSITALKPVANVAATLPVTQKTTLEPKVPLLIARESDMKVSTELNVNYRKEDSTEVTKQKTTIPKSVSNVVATVPVTEKTTLEFKIPLQSQKDQIVSTSSVSVKNKLLLETKTKDDGDM